jgi:hypothetical protein
VTSWATVPAPAVLDGALCGITLRGNQVRLMLPPQAADRRSAQGADAPINQSREAHHTARPLHSPLRASALDRYPRLSKPRVRTPSA